MRDFKKWSANSSMFVIIHRNQLISFDSYLVGPTRALHF